MSDENKEPMVDEKKGAEEKTQLSEEALSKVSGGGTPKQAATGTLNESVSFSYEQIKFEYSKQ